jgi:peptidoglycan/LPS O-acetylase OafA/YrhL
LSDEKLVLLGTPEQALLPALILSVVLVVPIAALTYRWIEKPAMDAARRGLSPTRGTTSGITSLVPWLRAGSARRIGLILRWRARSLVVSPRASIARP